MKKNLIGFVLLLFVFQITANSKQNDITKIKIIIADNSFKIPPPGVNMCDVYLLDYENHNRFLLRSNFMYDKIGSRENIKSGTVNVPVNIFQNGIYLAIRNNSNATGIEVLIEVVAIVVEKEYEYRDEIETKINTKRVPYMI